MLIRNTVDLQRRGQELGSAEEKDKSRQLQLPLLSLRIGGLRHDVKRAKIGGDSTRININNLMMERRRSECNCPLVSDILSAIHTAYSRIYHRPYDHQLYLKAGRMIYNLLQTIISFLEHSPGHNTGLYTHRSRALPITTAHKPTL